MDREELKRLKTARRESLLAKTFPPVTREQAEAMIREATVSGSQSHPAISINKTDGVRDILRGSQLARIFDNSDIEDMLFFLSEEYGSDDRAGEFAERVNGMFGGSIFTRVYPSTLAAGAKSSGDSASGQTYLQLDVETVKKIALGRSPSEVSERQL